MFALMLAAAGCGSSSPDPLDADARRDGGPGAEGADGGRPFTCSVDCSACLPSIADTCEAAAELCEDPSCCLQVELAFACDDAPPPTCPFDCGQCEDPGDRLACFDLEDQCGSEPSQQDECCELVATTFEGCGDDPEPPSCYDCTLCETETDEQSCELAVQGCEDLPRAQRDICCANVGTLLPACDPTGGGACGVDCAACEAGVQPACDQAQQQCEGLVGVQRVQCCTNVVSAFGGDCGGGGEGCDVDCGQCPTATGRATCEQAKTVCETAPDPAMAAECCAQLANNLDFICAF